MNLKLVRQFRQLSFIAIIFIFSSVIVMPQPVKANFISDFFNRYSYGSNSNYNYYGSQNQGDLELAKGARRIGRDDDYHQTVNVRSGGLVEILIQVRNKSSRNEALTTIQDELGGSVVYVKNSLQINGQTTNRTGLTSGGIQILIPARGYASITYQMYVCGGSGYETRATAYSAGIGSATAGVIIQMEGTNYYNDNTSLCLNQFQSGSTNNYNSTFGSTYSNNSPNNLYSNPFGEWTGVNNLNSAATPNAVTNPISNNPFAGWTGVNNLTTVNTNPASNPVTNNPFSGWTGVDNSQTVTPTNNVFGTWTGVDNSHSSSLSNNVFGTWTGVNNSNQVNNPFGDWATSNVNGVNNPNANNNNFGTWTGVNNSTQTTNPFGDWSGTNNSTSDNLGYDMRGYAINRTVASADKNSNSNSYANTSNTAPTNFVAPTTGVNPWAPIEFGGLLIIGYAVFRYRKLIFT